MNLSIQGEYLITPYGFVHLKQVAGLLARRGDEPEGGYHGVVVVLLHSGETVEVTARIHLHNAQSLVEEVMPALLRHLGGT